MYAQSDKKFAAQDHKSCEKKYSGNNLFGLTAEGSLRASQV